MHRPTISRAWALPLALALCLVPSQARGKPGDASLSTEPKSITAKAAVMAATGSSYPARIEKTQYHGWNVFRLTNGIISLDVAPDPGGRALQLRLGEQEYFFVNENGLIVVPTEGLDKLPAAVEVVRTSERTLMEFVRGPDFTFEGLRKRVLE
jgi:hypothetical protein